MQSCLIVALCVVGCAIAVQAKPHVGIEHDIDGPYDAVPTDLLLRAVYNKLKYNILSYSHDDIAALRERLSKFILAVEDRLFIGSVDVEKEKALRSEFKRLPFAKLADFARTQHQEILKILFPTDEKNLRIALNEFLDDNTSEIEHYMDSIWPTVFRYPSIETFYINSHEPVTEESSFKDLLSAGIRKLRELRDCVWNHKKIELANAIIKIIKQADAELIKNNHKEEVDQMLARTPYEKFSELSLHQLSKEASFRAEFLLENVWDSEIVDVKTALVDFINTVEKNTSEFE
uniref:Uncharacterized protein n=1 Tax=Panagrellus redivivus TaxID=6233 RepID=A0A7E4VHR1_PANRE